MRLSVIGAISVLLLATAQQSPAVAQTAAVQPAGAGSPVGDWNGALVVSGVTYRVGLHIDQTAPGVFNGSVGSHETGRWGTKLDPLTFADGALSFAAPAANASFKGAWDPAKGGYVGTYTTASGPVPFTFAPGAIAPLPTVAGLDGRWEGKVEGLDFSIILRVSTSERGTAVMVDFPTQNRNNIVGQGLMRDGAAVTFTAPTAMANLKGTLSSDGKSLAATWTQSSVDIPLTFVRTADAAGPAPPLPARPATQ